MKNILVLIPHRGLGDLIYLLPFFRSLHEKYKSKINIISNITNKASIIYKNENFVKSIHNFRLNHKNLFFNLDEKFKYLKKINSLKSDLLIITSRHSSLILPFHLAKIKKKIMFDLKFLYFKDPKTKTLSSSERILQNTRKFNLSYSKKKIFLIGAKTIKTNNIFFNLDSHHNQNNWPVDNFLEIINKIYYNFKNIYVNFSPKNKEIKKKISKHFLKKKIQITSDLKFIKILDLINNSDIVVGNESGPLCIGLGFKKKIISLYNPLHTYPESILIKGNSTYFNTKQYSDKNLKKKIVKKIISLKKKTIY